MLSNNPGGMEWKVGGRFKREGTCVYLRLIHVDVWQKPIQYCKAIILQLKKKEKLIIEGRESQEVNLKSPRCLALWLVEIS